MSADEDQEKSEATRARRRHRGWRATGAVGREGERRGLAGIALDERPPERSGVPSPRWRAIRRSP